MRLQRAAGAWRLGFVAVLLFLLSGAAQLRAQSPTLEVNPDSSQRNAFVRTANLLEDTPWLTALRQGLPVQLRYRVEVWRSREGWFDALANQYEWQVVVRHQPLLDQFTVYLIFPGRKVRSNVYATPGALGKALGSPYAIPLRPSDEGTYYYAASLDVQTLSDSDLEDFNKVIKGEIVQGGGGSLAERARRLALQLAGLPKLGLTARSSQFEFRK